MSTEWVDFKKVKEVVDMQMVLDHYAVRGLTKSGDELRGPCPIHKGSQRSKDFTVNVRKNAFKCFSKACGLYGNVLDLVAAMEQCSVRDAALKLQEWFKIGESDGDRLAQLPHLITAGELEALEHQFTELHETASKLGRIATKGLVLVADIKGRMATFD